ASEEKWSRVVLEPPEVWGVEALNLESVIVRAVIKTRAAQQWAVARELRERGKDRSASGALRCRTRVSRGGVGSGRPGPQPNRQGTNEGQTVTEQGAETFYDQVGGHETFHLLVQRFYQGVAQDPALRSMYPEEDLSGAEDRLRMFLEQYWGGPKTYSQTRGHPRLRMRHAPFAVSPGMHDRWLLHMKAAV